MTTRIRVARIVSGAIGLLVGYLIWQWLWNTAHQEVSAASMDAIAQSRAFVSLVGLAAVGLVLGCSLICAALTESVVRWSTRRREF